MTAQDPCEPVDGEFDLVAGVVVGTGVHRVGSDDYIAHRCGLRSGRVHDVAGMACVPRCLTVLGLTNSAECESKPSGLSWSKRGVGFWGSFQNTVE
jgi:hypothetical protein